jgi:hypothetical protein
MMWRLSGVLILVAAAIASLAWAVMLPANSTSAEPQDASRPGRDEFAADRVAEFDGGRAMQYLEAICKIGPRISGTEGMRKQREYLQKHFAELGGKVELQHFPARQKSQQGSVEMANLIVSWFPERKRRVILCAHYDTRPIADQEPDPRKWRSPFLSANDGASGVALLMEMANYIKDVKTPVGVDFVLFDGEEYIFNPAVDGDRYFFGSEYFAKMYRQERPAKRYVAGVLFDMIGGKNAQFPVEQNSAFLANSLVQDLWHIAADQKCAAFKNEWGAEVRDDHLALNKAGIPTVDIIDFSYPHWHRLTDLPENCSGDSLRQVARVIKAWLERVN